LIVALPQPAVLATSAASYLVAPAAGRRVTAWLEFPAARAATPDAAARRRANRLVIADRTGRRAHVVYDGGCGAAQACDTVAAPQAGSDTVLYAVADGRHADLAAATMKWRVAWVAFGVAVFGWGIGFFGPAIYLPALHQLHGCYGMRRSP
jgi:hypothetical protein